MTNYGKTKAEIDAGPDVWFVLVEYDTVGDGNALMQPLYAVQLPQDLGRFRIRPSGDDPAGVMLKFRGRWRRVVSAWRQLKDIEKDAAEARPYAVRSFARLLSESRRKTR